MNKLQAFQESFDLWDWLYKNPGKREYDYPDYDLIEDYINEDPLCEFFKESCEKCILKSCMKDDTDFKKWDNYYGNWSIAVQMHAAKKIRDKIKKELNRLKKNFTKCK